MTYDIQQAEEQALLKMYRENPESLVVCSFCDQIHKMPSLTANQVAHCDRCHSAIAYPAHVEVEHTIALAITSLFLIVGSIRYEFLGVSQSGLSQTASITDVIVSFNSGWYLLLGIFVGAFVVGLPVVRCLTLIYVLWPLMRGKPPYENARKVFGFSQDLGPWLMTEIFIIGVAVALVKIVAMASVQFGASFWTFCLLVACMGIMNATVHKKAVWDLLRKDVK